MSKSTLSIRKKTPEALNSRVDNLRSEIREARKSLILGESQDVAKIGHLRKELAQTLTILSEQSKKEGQ